RCCGGPLLGMDESLAEEIGKEKVNNIIDAGAKGIITACAFCDIQLTQAQLGEGIKKGKRIPVIPLPQFLGAALGIQDDILGFHLNKISAEPILATLKGAR
ncbi:MAG: heterodisulfide reductase-related iron-sulfur binding cluster, partial [Candidatus Thorarchaeota archaeon]